MARSLADQGWGVPQVADRSAPFALTAFDRPCEVVDDPSRPEGDQESEDGHGSSHGSNVAFVEGVTVSWTCLTCDRTLRLDQFRRRESGRPMPNCLACSRRAQRARSAKYREENRTVNNEYQQRWRKAFGGSERLREYKTGIRWADHEAMFLFQGQRCPICWSSDAKSRRGWHMDHDHVTGVLRGITCGPCNTSMGMMGDDPDRLEAAATYLRRSR